MNPTITAAQETEILLSTLEGLTFAQTFVTPLGEEWMALHLARKPILARLKELKG